MFCKHCGAQVADGVKFCPSCGNATGAGSAPKTQQTAAPSGNASANPAHTGATASHTAPKMPKMHARAAAPSGVKYKKRFNIGNYAVWVGCALTIASLFMTFLTASVSLLGISQSESVKLIDKEDGLFFLGIAIAIAVVNIFKLNILAIIGSGFAAFMLNVELQDIEHTLRGFGSMIEYGAGRTLLILGIVIMLAASIAAFVLNILAKKKAMA